MLYPKISIITPLLNAQATIRETLISVLQQDYKNIEYIIVDGLSTDNSISIIKEFNCEFIKIISEKDNGVYDAMNKALDYATGDWIYFLGSDDVLEENILSKVFSNNQFPGYDIVYGNVKFKHQGIIYNGEYNFCKLFKDNICHQAIFFNSSVFPKLGRFNLEYPINADYEFNIRWMGAPEINSIYIPEVIATYNELGMSGLSCDELILNDKFFLFRKHFKKISKEHISLLFNELGRLGIDRLAKKQIYQGLSYVGKAFIYGSDKKHLLKNTIYWILIHLGIKNK